jgi:hypothetical protein
MNGMGERLGWNVHLANNPQLWAAAASLGIRYCRIDGNWDTAQLGPDQWNWEVIDLAVSGARTHGLNVFMSLSHTPSWANNGAGRGALPTSIIDWTRFVREAGLRYGPQSPYGHVQVWGIWNEYQGSVGDYINILYRPAHEVLKTLDPNNLVCGPELATEGPWPTWLHTFLREAGALVDVITVHCYADTGLEVWRNLTQPRKWYEVWKKPSIKEVIEGAGSGAKPCWCTETGWRSDVYGEDGQAQRWDQLLERFQGASWPAGILGFNLIDEVPPDREPVTFGVCRADLTLKPAAEVIQRYTQPGVV